MSALCELLSINGETPVPEADTNADLKLAPKRRRSLMASEGSGAAIREAADAMTAAEMRAHLAAISYLAAPREAV